MLARGAGRRRRCSSFERQGGAALLEVITALLIMAVVSLSLIELFSYSEIFVSTASQEIAALNRAQDVMEEIKSLRNSGRGWARGGDSRSIVIEAAGIDDATDPSLCMVVLISGRGAGQVRRIASFDSGAGRAFVDPCWDIPPQAEGTSYLLLRDRPCRDDLRITAVDGDCGDLQTITVAYVKQVRGESQEISLTAEKRWW